MKTIYRLLSADENSPDEPVKLLEVNEETVESGIEPIYFGPHPASGINYPSALIDITPHEFNLLKEGELQLPFDWAIGERIAPPAVANR